MRTRRRIGVLSWSVLAFVLLALSVPLATKGDSFFVLYKLHFQIRNSEDYESQIGLVVAILLLLAGLACLTRAAINVKKHLAHWDWIWPVAALIGGLTVGVIQGQVFDCSVYFPLEICRPDLA